MNPALDALVLAAGQSSRFGLPKLIMPAGRHKQTPETLISRTITCAASALKGHVALVLGRDADLLQTAIRSTMPLSLSPRIHITTNPHYQKGRSSSLRAGLSLLLHKGYGRHGVVIMLADQADGLRDVLPALIYHFLEGTADTLSAAEHGAQRPPVFLRPEIYPYVFTLRGDEGMKQLIKRRSERHQLIELGQGMHFFDVDTWDNYTELVRLRGWSEPYTPPTPTTLTALHLSLQTCHTLIETYLTHPPPPQLGRHTLLIPFPQTHAAASFTDDLVVVTLPAPHQHITTLLFYPDTLSARAYLSITRRAALWLLDHPFQPA